MTFGRQHTGLGRGHGSRGSERDRRLFIAAAVLAMSLLLVLAVVFKFKVSNASQQQANTEQMGGVEESSMASVTLLAPERPVKAGRMLSDVKFKTMYWPRNQVPEGAIRSVEELRGKYARIALSAGTPIQRSDLTDRPALSVLPLTKGNRAVTIPIDAESAIEYHVLPGTSVDVVLTHYVGSDVRSKVIVQNARVLSLGGNTEGQKGGKKTSMQSKTVTLDVAPQDALQIIAAKQLGRLSLLLRDQGDEAPIPVDEMAGGEVTNAQNDQKRQNPSSRGCVGGRVKIEGNEFLVSCDGTIYRDAGDLEP